MWKILYMIVVWIKLVNIKIIINIKNNYRGKKCFFVYNNLNIKIVRKLKMSINFFFDIYFYNIEFNY